MVVTDRKSPRSTHRAAASARHAFGRMVLDATPGRRPVVCRTEEVGRGRRIGRRFSRILINENHSRFRKRRVDEHLVDAVPERSGQPAADTLGDSSAERPERTPGPRIFRDRARARPGGGSHGPGPEDPDPAPRRDPGRIGCGHRRSGRLRPGHLASPGAAVAGQHSHPGDGEPAGAARASGHDRVRPGRHRVLGSAHPVPEDEELPGLRDWPVLFLLQRSGAAARRRRPGRSRGNGRHR
jgi:hypothetical protein